MKIQSDLQLQIKPFLYTNEWLNLTSTCKGFKESRTLTLYIKLSYYYSEKYYNNIEFRNRINNIIYNPLNQLSLSFYNFNFNNLDIISNIHTLIFINCHNLTDISIFSNSYNLTFNNCSNITNNNNIYFKNLKYLELNCCPNITNLLPFTNISHLVLLFSNIKILPYFQNLNKIQLIYLDELENITSLSNNNMNLIDIRYCKKIKTLSNITNINTLL